jgi:LPPG:FO 2-phospho-L-lactate transferase
VRITALAGGIGGARFLVGLLAHLRTAYPDGAGGTTAEVTVVGNTGDDIRLYGLQVCPDLDTVMYTLGGGISAERGWGREGETFVVKEELAAYGVEPGWFGLGDRDTATHLVRSQMLAAGYPLSAVTEALCVRWEPGVRLLPMTDDRVETHVVVDGDEAGTRRAIHFQEWWIRYRAELPAYDIVLVGADDAKAGPGVAEAIRDADVVLLPPSNPVVSIGTILQVPGVRDAVREARGPVVGVSPIVGGAPVRGMADACLTAVGVETSAAAVARHYGTRRAVAPERGRDTRPAEKEQRGAPSSPEGGGVLDGWLVHDGSGGPASDAGCVEQLTAAGITTRAVPLLMTDPDATAALAAATLSLAASLTPQVR